MKAVKVKKHLRNGKIVKGHTRNVRPMTVHAMFNKLSKKNVTPITDARYFSGDQSQENTAHSWWERDDNY